MGATIRVTQPGLLTTVQDLGRVGRLGMALSRGGALDRNALSLANALVGNSLDAAGLEITGHGPALRFEQSSIIAWAGAGFDADLFVDGTLLTRLKSHRPILIPAKSVVRWKSPMRGFRAWIAIAGGIEAPKVLQSRSSHLAAQVGLGRLEKNMELPLGEHSGQLTQLMTQHLLKDTRLIEIANGDCDRRCLIPRWSIPEQLPSDSQVLTLHAYKGRHFGLLSHEQQRELWNSVFHVSSKSNRQGLRLEGPAMVINGVASLPSEPVRFGTVQLPPEGIPYVLLAEHQTTGGYPRVLEVCSSMVRELAQAGPGVRVRFAPITLDESQQRLRDNDLKLGALLTAIDAKLRS